MRPAMLNDTHFVYFAKKRGLIKIGFSSDPRTRLRALGRTRFLGCMLGGRELEKKLHAMFAKQRVHGEWFKAESTLKDYIAARATRIALPHKSTSVKVQAEKHHILREVARRRGTTLSVLVDRILGRYLREQTEKSK
jgi:T5orf172 domain